MIISASRRTDIPAFYADWFLRRLEAGYCQVANPFNSRQVRSVSLRPEDVDAVVFWTKYAGPLRARLDELDASGIPYYFLYTLTRYGRVLEPRVPPPGKLVEDFLALSRQIGPERVIWRYDPIIVSREFSPDRHLEVFAELAAALQGATRRVIISFVDYYAKTRKNLAGYLRQYGPTVERPEQEPWFERFITSLASMCTEFDLEIRSCAETRPMERFGVRNGKCIDNEYIRQTLGVEVPGRKDPGQRGACGCVTSVDIGAYDTCVHGCRYCYATRNHRLALNRYQRIDPKGPSLNEGAD